MELLQLIFPPFLIVFCQDRIPHVRVILGDLFALPVNCQTNEEGRLYRDRVYGTPGVEVAAHKRGVWKPAEVYHERISESSTVVFNPAVYTDTGLYVLSCGARKVDIQVEVVTSSDRAVSEGAAVSLPCFVSTTGSACWSLRWEKNGTVVFERDSCASRSTGAADPRLSVSANWLLHGDFSLSLQQAGSDDRGDYFCIIQNKVVVTAARLTVNERSTDQTPSTPPFVSPPVCPFWSWITCFITAVGFAVVGLLAWVVWYLRKGILRGCARPVDVEVSHRGEDRILTAVSIRSGGGPLCNDGEDGESDSDHQNMQRSNGHLTS